MAIWVGVDVGTQSLKTVLWQPGVDGGRILGEASSGYGVRYPQARWAEQDPADWEAALGRTIGVAMAIAAITPGDLAGIGITGQLDGAIAVSAAGEPLAPAMIWQDRRSDCELSLGFDHVQALTGQLIDPGHLAPKARWLTHALARRDGALGARGAVRFHQPVSYLVERLTGRAVIDPSLASTTLLFDLARQRWSQELCTAWGLELSSLPELAPSYAIADRLHAGGAALTGLPVGLPVGVGTGDDFAAALGAGLTRPGRVMCSLGTAEVVGALSERPVIDRGHGPPIVETHAYPTGHFFVENPGWSCGGSVAWLRRLVGFASDAELDAAAAAAPPGSAGVGFFPALAGAMTPAWAPDVRGAFTGLSGEHDRGHLARAVLEGTAFACRDVLARLDALGVSTDRVLLTGGGSRSPLWSQLRANVLARPHQLSSCEDSAAVGAAMLAAVATGGLRLDELEHQAGAPRRILEPEQGSGDAYEEAYQRYRRTCQALL